MCTFSEVVAFCKFMLIFAAVLCNSIRVNIRFRRKRSY